MAQLALDEFAGFAGEAVWVARPALARPPATTRERQLTSRCLQMHGDVCERNQVRIILIIRITLIILILRILRSLFVSIIMSFPSPSPSSTGKIKSPTTSHQPPTTQQNPPIPIYHD